MAITTLNGLVAAFDSVSQVIPIAFAAQPTYNTPVFLNYITTMLTGAMTIPTARGSGGEIPTKGTAGAGANFVNPAGANKTYIANMSVIMSGSSDHYDIAVFDRVYAASGFSGTTTTAQTITAMPALTRPGATGAGLEIWLEIYTAIGSTTSSVTVQYTNSASTAGRNTVAYDMTSGGSVVAGTCYCLPLQEGDLGVQSIQSVTLTSSTGTAGDFGIALYKPLCALTSAGKAPRAINAGFGATNLAKVDDDAFLAFVCHGPATTGVGTVGSLTLVQG